jgi:hypothetical protein
VQSHPRENRDVVVRALDPPVGAEQQLSEQVVELQVASRDERLEEEDVAREFRRRRLGDLRVLFRAEAVTGTSRWTRGPPTSWAAAASWSRAGAVAFRPSIPPGRTGAGESARGSSSRLRAAQRYGAPRLVIAANPDYHALGLYESLGFQRIERVAGVCRPPGVGLQAEGGRCA